MQAVWSFWTRPFAGRCGIPWPSEKHHLLSWILSVETARKHYPQTALVTDEEGADLLVDQLGLEFTHVSTELTALSGADPAMVGAGQALDLPSSARTFHTHR